VRRASAGLGMCVIAQTMPVAMADAVLIIVP